MCHEHQELISLSEIIETADVQRLEHLAELAKLRGISLREIRDQLGFPKTSPQAGQINAWRHDHRGRSRSSVQPRGASLRILPQPFGLLKLPLLG